MCQVIFGNVGITSLMVPKEAAAKIKHLLVTTSEHGVSDGQTLLAALKEFDEYLKDNNIKRPVVLLSDGHSSRFDYHVMSFLQSKDIWMFLTPPDTTGVTQLLDQLNKNIHHEYRKEKDEMFTEANSLNKEAFMLILANIWDKWATKPTLIKAAKRVGITNEGLSIEFMQQDKFDRAENCMEAPEEASVSSTKSTLSSPDSSFVVSPDRRKGSALYWREKFESAQSLINELHEKSIQLEEIPGFMTIRKVKPSLSTSSTRITQVHGSMKAKDVLSLVADINEKKEQKVRSQLENAEKKEEVKKIFIKCKEKCVCTENICKVTKFRECPKCHDILKSQCSKLACRVEGKKPKMIFPASALQKIIICIE